MSHTLRLGLVATALASVACANTQSTGPVTTPRASSAGPVDAGPVAVNIAPPNTIPVGQELDVRLQDSLSSETASVEQRFEATTAVDLMQNGRVLVPAGSVVRGVISNVDKAGRIDRDGSLTLAFDRLTVKGHDHEIRAAATQVFESGGIREEAARAGVGAGAGSIVGGLLGGVQGAILGAVIGAGGIVAATDGKDISLPVGTIVRIRFDSPVDLG